MLEPTQFLLGEGGKYPKQFAILLQDHPQSHLGNNLEVPSIHLLLLCKDAQTSNRSSGGTQSVLRPAERHGLSSMSLAWDPSPVEHAQSTSPSGPVARATPASSSRCERTIAVLRVHPISKGTPSNPTEETHFGTVTA